MCEVVQVFCETPYPLNIVMRNEALKCYSFAEKNNNILDDSVDEFPPSLPIALGTGSGLGWKARGGGRGVEGAWGGRGGWKELPLRHFGKGIL